MIDEIQEFVYAVSDRREENILAARWSHNTNEEMSGVRRRIFRLAKYPDIYGEALTIPLAKLIIELLPIELAYHEYGLGAMVLDTLKKFANDLFSTHDFIKVGLGNHILSLLNPLSAADAEAEAKLVKEACKSPVVCYCNRFIRGDGPIGSCASACMVCDNCGRPMLGVLEEYRAREDELKEYERHRSQLQADAEKAKEEAAVERAKEAETYGDKIRKATEKSNYEIAMEKANIIANRKLSGQAAERSKADSIKYRWERFVDKLKGKISFDTVDTVDIVPSRGFMSLCPAHNDHNPSLFSKLEANGKITVECKAGCSTAQILDAMNLEFDDLCAIVEIGAAL